MIYRANFLKNIRYQNDTPKDLQQIIEEEVTRNTDGLDSYSKQLEILNQANVMINSAREVPSILRITAMAALELWESDGGAAGIVDDGQLLFQDLYWMGEHHAGQFRCNILPELSNMTRFMGVLDYDDDHKKNNLCFPNVIEGEIKERLAIPIYDRQLRVNGCLLLFNPDRSFFERTLIDNPMPGLIASTATALDNTRNINELKETEMELQTSNTEKALLLKEIHHRVKNNLQAIVGLLDTHLDAIQNPRDKEIFLKGQSLAMGMARIHELLYSTEDYTRIDFSVYTRELIKSVLKLYPGMRGRVKVEYSLDNLYLNTDTAIPVSLIINELVSNALIHAFPHGRKGTIAISMKQVGKGGFLMEINDDGVGVPDPDGNAYSNTLGLNLVRTLIENLSGTIKVKVNGGTRITISFKEYFECENLELG